MSDRYLAAINKGRGGRDPYLGAINRGAPGRPAPMGGASGTSVGSRVLQALKGLARLSPYMVPAVAVAGMAVADEVGMARAASVWKFGMGSRLDDGVKNLMPQILATSKSGWIAADQEEFARVQALFHREVGALRNAFGEIGGVMDEVAAGFRTYWLQLGSAVATAGTLLVAALRMKLSMVPAVSSAGMIMEHLVGSMMLSTVTVFTGMLGSMLKNGMDVLGNLIKKSHQFGFVLPVGAAAIDFTQATMDTRDLPTYAEPPAPGRLPAGHQDFEWVAPDVRTG